MSYGLRDALEASGQIQVVGQAGDGEEAVKTVEELRPEVIVMDVIAPNKDGIDACQQIMEHLPDVGVPILTASTERQVVHAGLRGEGQQQCHRAGHHTPDSGQAGSQDETGFVIWAVRNGLVDDVVVEY